MRTLSVSAVSAMLATLFLFTLLFQPIAAAASLPDVERSVDTEVDVFIDADGVLTEIAIDPNGEETKLTYEMGNDSLQVTAYLDGQILDYAVVHYDNGVPGDTIEYHDMRDLENPQTTIHSMDKFITNKGSQTKPLQWGTENDFLGPLSSPSYPYLDQDYSPVWGYTGYLHGEETQYLDKFYVNYNFNPGEALTIVAASLVAHWIGGPWWVGGLIGALIELGVSIVGGKTDLRLKGWHLGDHFRWDYEVWVMNTLSLVRYSIYKEAIYVNQTTGKQFFATDHVGTTETWNEMIHMGIYTYAVTS